MDSGPTDCSSFQSALSKIVLMPKPIQVDKKKFDELLDRMLKTPPLPKAEINIKKKAAKSGK